MEMSSKLKAMKFMKRKDEAEERKQVEKETQKSVERTHWTLEEEKMPSSSETPKLKFIVEYDNTGGISGPDAIVRQSFKNFKAESELETADTDTGKSSKVNNSSSSGGGAGPANKMPKLSENKKKKNN